MTEPFPVDYVHFVVGVIESEPNTLSHIGIPQIFHDEEQARAQLGVTMTLCRLTHGDALVDAASWYLLSALPERDPGAGSCGVFYGYIVEDTVYPIAGAWMVGPFDRRLWEPFYYAFESQRAHEARLPWRTTMLHHFDLDDVAASHTIDFSYFQLTPVSTELLARPLDLFVTEPLF